MVVLKKGKIKDVGIDVFTINAQFLFRFSPRKFETFPERLQCQSAKYFFEPTSESGKTKKFWHLLKLHHSRTDGKYIGIFYGRKMMKPFNYQVMIQFV